MGIAYIKVPPEEAIKILDECIVEGYQVKDKINQEYYSDKSGAEGKIGNWQQVSIDWTNNCLKKLGDVFVSLKELFNFRDARPPFGATSENVHFIGIIDHIKARIDRLNEYDRYIRDEFNVKVEVVGRDKIIQQGDNPKVEIKN
ncbi:hypothetical protein A3D78_06700 [Candidatus Gottesmanbacteria bacterium RIFCSPHIGHO2_02_FULL_39_14]|uniref:Uncharacterized protein n=1 Tax=Candidatus Gottesmanbacteria bacterium RIFCSPHIGHO2_02_FULL_39_14 TaxID=1798383 RepID=A0A1F6A2Y8_9BACT|nr:MAG: hypothetical protein A3D78_06700 [Candidatus Gottesmanbacteria bacterium RIFCSPHIGHO2_02_FULL_39_14]